MIELCLFMSKAKQSKSEKSLQTSPEFAERSTRDSIGCQDVEKFAEGHLSNFISHWNVRVSFVELFTNYDLCICQLVFV